MNKIQMMIALATALLSLTACNEHAPLRDGSNAQNTALTNLKYQELAPAEGTFSGEALIISTNQKYKCVLQIKRTMQTQHPTDQPTETLEVPTLSAHLNFPLLSSLKDTTDIAKYPDLRDPMGGANSVSISNGDYNPNNNLVDLPYMVSGWSPTTPNTPFGELRLTLSGDSLTGDWSVAPLGDVGTITLTRTTVQERK